MAARVEVIERLEPDVVWRAAAGDEGAFAELVACFHADLVRVGFAVAGDVEMGRDAAQAAWETAWRKLPTLRDHGKVRSWLLAIAANEARRLARRRRLRELIERRSRPAASRADIEPSAIAIDLGRALARLNPRDRQLLAMRYAVGLTSEEIADVMALSSSGVRSQLSRLLARLRKDLSDE